MNCWVRDHLQDNLSTRTVGRCNSIWLRFAKFTSIPLSSQSVFQWCTSISLRLWKAVTFTSLLFPLVGCSRYFSMYKSQSFRKIVSISMINFQGLRDWLVVQYKSKFSPHGVADWEGCCLSKSHSWCRMKLLRRVVLGNWNFDWNVNGLLADTLGKTTSDFLRGKKY